MSSERDEILNSVDNAVANTDSDAQVNLYQALSEGERTKQLALSHEHEINMLRADLGWFGIVFGSESHASIVVAFVVVILGFLGALGLWIAAYTTGHTEFWASEAHISLAAATSALGYVFGRGSKDRHKS